MTKRAKLMKKVFFTASILAAIVLYLYFVGFECVYLKYFGIICPGCGMTRAIRALFELDFKGAFFYHPMVYAMPFVAFYIIRGGNVFKKQAFNYVVLSLIGAGFIINYLVNLYLLYWRL